MKIIVALLLCLFSLPLMASQRAVTDEGDIVILNDDGTWVFESPDTVESAEIPISEKEFTKTADSIFRLKSTKTNSEIWLDTKKWLFEKGTTDEAAEYTFRLRGGDLYGQLISEQVELDIVALTDVALENARSVAPGMKRTKREYRVVNGTKVLFMEMQGVLQGTNFTFRGYYFSNSTGSTQFLTYTGTNLVEKYDQEIQSFVNGFSVQKSD